MTTSELGPGFAEGADGRADPAPTALERRRRIADSLADFGSGTGLEVGPLDRPLLTRDRADVRYVDIYDRDRLATAHADTRSVDDIPEIDYPLWDGSRMRTLGEATKSGAPFDWVYASHVIEHVPDLIGWLNDIASVVADDGVLVLVVPDRRYCFDVHRPPSTVGQILQASTDGDVAPSVRAVYDHHRSAVQVKRGRLWRGRIPTYDDRIHDLDFVRQQLRRARDGEYLDCHVWTFTDAGFAEVIEELGALGEIDWRVDSLVPVPQGEIEFTVALRRGAGSTPVEPRPRARPDWITQTAELGRRVRRQQRRIEELEQQIASLTGSRRWRAASALAAPVRALRGLRSRP